MARQLGISDFLAAMRLPLDLSVPLVASAPAETQTLSASPVPTPQPPETLQPPLPEFPKTLPSPGSRLPWDHSVPFPEFPKALQSPTPKSRLVTSSALEAPRPRPTRATWHGLDDRIWCNSDAPG